MIDSAGDKAALAAVESLWKMLLQHDELVRARALLDTVPWTIRDAAVIEAMRKKTDAMLTHIDRADGLRSLYADYGGGAEAIPFPEAVRPEYSQAPRWNFAQACVKSLTQYGDPVRVLDVACMDGWITNRLGLDLPLVEGYGVDLAGPLIEIAARNAEKFPTGCSFAQRQFGVDALPGAWPKDYDAVIFFEVYEHLPDPDLVIRKAVELLRPGGLFLLSTPRGSWLQGEQVPHHPKWDEPKPREHIRAPTATDVRRDLLASGLREVGVVELPMPVAEVIGQATILAQGQKPHPS